MRPTNNSPLWTVPYDQQPYFRKCVLVANRHLGTRITFVITVIVFSCVRNDLALNASHILRGRGMMWVVGGLR